MRSRPIYPVALHAVPRADIMATNKPFYDVNQASELFEKFIQDHSREYKDDEDKKAHYEAFVKNLHEINKQNAQSTTCTFGINKFADYTEEERSSMFGCIAKK